jgi:hypothetical protein
LALLLFPARTSDGHPVMPIGQVSLATPLGAGLGFWLLGRAAPREPSEVERLARALLLFVPILLIAWFFAG